MPAVPSPLEGEGSDASPLGGEWHRGRGVILFLTRQGR